jgi:hypothetical protein
MAPYLHLYPVSTLLQPDYAGPQGTLPSTTLNMGPGPFVPRPYGSFQFQRHFPLQGPPPVHGRFQLQGHFHPQGPFPFSNPTWPIGYRARLIQCYHCRRIGHIEANCWTKHPELSPEWKKHQDENKDKGTAYGPILSASKNHADDSTTGSVGKVFDDHLRSGSTYPSGESVSMRGGRAVEDIVPRADRRIGALRFSPVEQENEYVDFLTLKELVQASEPDYHTILQDT